MTGYSVTPEGTGSGNSRTVTLEDLAAIAGVDLPDHAGGTAAGYLRLFGRPTGDGVAAVMGFDLGAGDASDFVAGFREAGEEQATSMPLFPEAASPSGDVVAYEVADPLSSRHTLVTAFASDSIVVVVLAADPVDSVAVLRQMAQDQAALTPPTSAPAERPENMAYTLGRITGFVLILCVPAWLIIRAVRHREPPSLAVPRQTAPPGSYAYPARGPGIPLPPLERSSEAPPPPPLPPRRSGIPLPPLERSSED